MDVLHTTNTTGTTSPIVTLPALSPPFQIPTSYYWAATISVLFLTFLAHLSWRPSFPESAPKLLSSEIWPVVGALRFFGDRLAFERHAQASSPTGNYSFYYGKHRVVSVSGAEARRVFYESKDLRPADAYAIFLATQPTPRIISIFGDPEFTRWFTRNVAAMITRDSFVRNVPVLVGDTRTLLSGLAARATGGPTSAGGVLDPFDDIYRLVYQLSMRTVGATELAESPSLLAKSLAFFEVFHAESPATIIFPWLVTPGQTYKIWTGVRLFALVYRVVHARKRSGRRADDAVQYLLDEGEDVTRIVTFVVCALFGTQVNSGINAAWGLVYLATNQEWYGRVRQDVDACVAKYRTSPAQTPLDVLHGISVHGWETELPMIDLVLKETIRHTLVGSKFRKNVSGRDVALGNGEVLPKDGFLTTHCDNVNMNPDIYTEPERWDPSRFLPDRAEDKKVPYGYIGWGAGRRMCLGMRFAKLEMCIIVAVFFVMFDFSLVDVEGNPMTAVPGPDRNRHAPHKPTMPFRLQYTLREQPA